VEVIGEGRPAGWNLIPGATDAAAGGRKTKMFHAGAKLRAGADRADLKLANVDDVWMSTRFSHLGYLLSKKTVP